MTKQTAYIGLILSGLLYCSTVIAQKKHVSLRDSLDHAFDLSNYIIEANGFVPVPILITEPALGGFGGGLAPVFIKKQQPIIKDGKVVPVPPDITAAMGMYTANNSWLAGAGRFGTIRKWGIRYRAFAAYGDINMAFYKTLPAVGEKEFDFNMKVVPVYLFAEKQIGASNWFAGLQYTYTHTKLALRNNDKLPDWVTDKEVSSSVSELGAVIEYDSRDNIFTPDRGLKAHAHFNVSNSIFGSDYNYERLNSFMYWYQPLAQNKATGKNWISGLRFDLQYMFGDAPFYLLPFIDMRGIPSARYQGKINALMETEQRWDFTRRWSSVFFGGVGKAFNEFSDFGSADWVYSYGIGGRYLLARKFKLRVGVDLARGPEKFAYYIVFGSNWIK